MKIAVPYDKNGQVHPHLTEAGQFKIYEVMDDEILSSRLVPVIPGQDAPSLTAFLQKEGAAVLLCGLTPVSVVIALQSTPIQLLGGASGSADDRVRDFLNGTLHFDRGGASCASCSLARDHAAGAEKEPECDGNLSACGHWCQ